MRTIWLLTLYGCAIYLLIVGLRVWLGDGPPPSERPGDTFYGLSEGE